MSMRYVLVSIWLATVFAISAKNADLVIFSYNRPLQLYALLESVETYITGLHTIHVIWRASHEDFTKAYKHVQQTFKDVHYLAQGDDPKKDFKPLTLKAFNGSSSEYILFAVDDIIVKDFINIESDITLLQKTDAYGMYYRLGLHLTDCYPMRTKQPLPRLTKIENDIYTWRFNPRIFNDWSYSHTVDMTLFKKSDIRDFFLQEEYAAPNPLEAKWACCSATKKFGLCHARSKIVNLPLNLVQNGTNRNSGSLSTDQLLEKFNAGLKIDIKPLFQINNPSAHIDYVPRFVHR